MSIFFYSKDSYSDTRASYLRFQNIDISESFMVCADEQLRKDFELKTGIKISKKIGISTPVFDIKYTKGAISQFTPSVYLNHNWIPVTIKWKSKSGKIYGFEDEIDCADITFWFDDLNTKNIHELMYPGEKLPFAIKNLDYELKVSRLNIDCELTLLFTNDVNHESIIKVIDDFINDFNTKSEKKDGKDGFIHNWKGEGDGNKIIFNLDLGSAGPIFLKKLLPFLSEIKGISEVEIG